MINNFNELTPWLERAIARRNNQMAVCEKILEVLDTTRPMRAMAIATKVEIPNCPEWIPAECRHITCQKATAMLRNLRALGLVERVLISEEEVEVASGLGKWEYRPEDCVEINGEKFVRPGASKVWVEGEPCKVKQKIYGFVKIGA